jgi:hypothetical protein
LDCKQQGCYRRGSEGIDRKGCSEYNWDCIVVHHIAHTVGMPHSRMLAREFLLGFTKQT